MGFKLQDQIQKMRGIPGKYKRVLTAIANRARNDGTNFFEAKETIGAKSGVDRSTAFRNMDDLTEMGILPKAESHECGIDYCPRSTKHFSKPGNHWTQAYYIDLVALQKYDELRCKMLRKKKMSGVAKRTRVALQNATEVALHFEMQTGDTREARFTGSVEPSVLTDGSKKASEPVSLATTSLASPAACPASQESQTLSGCDLISEEQNQKQNQPLLPQTREEMYNDGLGSEFEPAIDLLHRISPNITDAMVREQLPLCARILSFFADTGEYNVQAAELVLKFNRAHRSGKYANKDDKKLYIRTAAQFLKALESENAFLLNDYDSHDFKNCETCREAEVFNYKVWLREIRLQEQRDAEQQRKNELAAAQRAARKAEEERIAKLCPDCKKNEPGQHMAYLGGGAGWKKLCDPCYDRKYEYQQEQLDIGKPLPISMKPYEPRPEYLEAKRKAEAAELAAKLDANEIDVPICTLCGQVTHARSCPTRQPKIQEATA